MPENMLHVVRAATEDPENDSWEQATVVEKVKKDLRTLSTFAAKLGFVLAIVCHIMPVQYRVICETLKQACTP